MHIVVFASSAPIDRALEVATSFLWWAMDLALLYANVS